MVVLLPEVGGFETVEASLDPVDLASTIEEIERQELPLACPDSSSTRASA
jgi:hypothetical protein